MEHKIRLQKYLSMAGIASRRDSEKLIREGRVKVNHCVVQEMGIKVDPKKDQVLVDNHPACLKTEYTYILLNKPAGFLTTTRDPYQRPTVFELIPKSIKAHLFPVGRLDLDTEGALLITSDGELTSRLMHPRYTISKTYLVVTHGVIPPEKLKYLRQGVKLKEGKTAPAKVQINRSCKIQNQTWLKITVHEGKKRQIKRMCSSIGHPVQHLKRLSFSFLTLENLEPGHYRFLTSKEVTRLYKITGLLNSQGG